MVQVVEHITVLYGLHTHTTHTLLHPTRARSTVDQKAPEAVLLRTPHSFCIGAVRASAEGGRARGRSRPTRQKMRLLKITTPSVLLLAPLLVTIHAKSPVVTPTTFDDIIFSGQVSCFIKFYANWCTCVHSGVARAYAHAHTNADRPSDNVCRRWPLPGHGSCMANVERRVCCIRGHGHC